MMGVERNGTSDSFLLVDVGSICQKDGDVTKGEYLRVGKEIMRALQEYGYAYLDNFGITKNTVEDLVDKVENIFDLDEETKLKYKRNLVTLHGYAIEKHEALVGPANQPRGKRETFDFRHGEAPTEVPGLQDIVTKFSASFYPLATKILKSIDLALDAPDNFLEKSHDFKRNSNVSCLRVVKIPPVKNVSENAIKVQEHVDVGTTFTFHLYQNTQGLQVKDKCGTWQNVNIPTNSILLFPSQVFQRLTSDRIKGTPHRVITPESEEVMTQTRYSVLYFIVPNIDALIKPFDGSDIYAPIRGADVIAKAVTALSNPNEY